MLSALRHDPVTARAMATLDGSERAAQLTPAWRASARRGSNPNVRAERAVTAWQKLETEHGQLRGFEHEKARAQIETRMKALAGAIKRDPPSGIRHALPFARARHRARLTARPLDAGENIERAIERSVARANAILEWSDRSGGVNDEQDKSDDEANSAAAAFEALRAEVSVLRRAVEAYRCRFATTGRPTTRQRSARS